MKIFLIFIIPCFFLSSCKRESEIEKIEIVNYWWKYDDIHNPEPSIELVLYRYATIDEKGNCNSVEGLSKKGFKYYKIKEDKFKEFIKTINVIKSDTSFDPRWNKVKMPDFYEGAVTKFVIHRNGQMQYINFYEDIKGDFDYIFKEIFNQKNSSEVQDSLRILQDRDKMYKFIFNNSEFILPPPPPAEEEVKSYFK